MKEINTFGERIRNLREKAGFSITKVSIELKIDSSLLSKIERNERPPSKTCIKKLAQIFNQDEQYLVSEFVSDQIAYKILEEKSDINILKIAEKKVKYLQSRNRNK